MPELDDDQPAAQTANRDSGPLRAAGAGPRVGSAPDAFLLRVSSVTRAAEERAWAHQQNGHRLRALIARRDGARARRQIFREVLADVPSEPSAPEQAPVAAAGRRSATPTPVQGLNAGVLELISAYEIDSALEPSFLDV